MKQLSGSKITKVFRLLVEQLVQENMKKIVIPLTQELKRHRKRIIKLENKIKLEFKSCIANEK